MNLPASDGVAHLELAAGVRTEPDDLIGQRVAHNLLPCAASAISRWTPWRGFPVSAGRCWRRSSPGAACRRSGAVPRSPRASRCRWQPSSTIALRRRRHAAGTRATPGQRRLRLHQPRAVPFDVARQVEFYELRAASARRRRGPAPAGRTWWWRQGCTGVAGRRRRFLLATGARSCSTPTSRTATQPRHREALSVPIVMTYRGAWTDPALLPWTKRPPGSSGRGLIRKIAARSQQVLQAIIIGMLHSVSLPSAAADCISIAACIIIHCASPGPPSSLHQALPSSVPSHAHRQHHRHTGLGRPCPSSPGCRCIIMGIRSSSSSPSSRHCFRNWPMSIPIAGVIFWHAVVHRFNFACSPSSSACPSGHHRYAAFMFIPASTGDSSWR